MPGVVLDRVVKAYGAAVIIPDLSLSIAEGEFVVIVGPSGCGKSTTAAPDRRAGNGCPAATIVIR